MAQPKGSIPWNKGLKKETDERVANISSNNRKHHLENPTFKGKSHTDATRQKMAEARNEMYANGWEPTCGRSKKYDYDSPIAGRIKVDGTWELQVAKYLDRLGVVWSRNRERFNYIRPDGKNATYQPDFFVKDWDTYVEVKGYQTALDNAKWEQFPHKLQVWKKDKIQQINGDMAERPIAQVC